MNADIANIIKSQITSVPFVDKIAGLVKTLTFTQSDGDKSFKKTIPIACDVTYEKCIKNKQTDLIPNTAFKSIIYFEDNGLNITEMNGDFITFASKLRLVCWLNLKKLGKTQCSQSALALMAILKSINMARFNSLPYSRIQIVPSSEVVKSRDIFSKYSYSQEEEKVQFLVYPYDYFAIDLNISFTVHKGCVDEWENETPIC